MALQRDDLTTPPPLADPSGPGVHAVLGFTDEDCTTPQDEDGGVAPSPAAYTTWTPWNAGGSVHCSFRQSRCQSNH